MVIAQGHVYWANLTEPTGSGPGFRRPVLVVQGDALNRSRLRTIVCVPLTSNLRWAEAPGNVLLPAKATGLPKDSVANSSQLITLDRALLIQEVGKLSKRQLDFILSGIDIGAWTLTPLPYHFVRPRQHVWRNRQADLRRGFLINHEFKLPRPLHGEICRFGTL